MLFLRSLFYSLLCGGAFCFGWGLAVESLSELEGDPFEGFWIPSLAEVERGTFLLDKSPLIFFEFCQSLA